jgi:hypothetical protein
MRTPWLLAWLTLGSLCIATGARADARSDHYAGLQLAPSTHAGFIHQLFFAGAGAELSLSKWLLVELSISGATRPILMNPRGDLPGALHSSLGVFSRAGGGTHTFVYGVGMSYSNRYECPRYCSLFATLGGPEEDRTAHDLLTLDFSVGYEARLASNFFLRGITRLEAPIYMSALTTRNYGPGEHSFGNDDDKSFLTRVAFQLTVGYAFHVPR